MAPTITRWDPFAELGELRSGIDRVLGDRLDVRGHIRLPAIDVVREDDQLVIRADMPGLEPDEVKVELDGTNLTISGEHEDVFETEERDYLRRERHYGSFYRTLTVPAGAKADAITATAKDGVIEVRLTLPQKPKAERVSITPTAG